MIESCTVYNLYLFCRRKDDITLDVLDCLVPNGPPIAVAKRVLIDKAPRFRPVYSVLFISWKPLLIYLYSNIGVRFGMYL
jgi:hypothetical protein